MSRTLSAIVTFVFCVSSVASAADVSGNYPILAIPRTAGARALLDHELTPKEHELFLEMDAKTGQLPRDAASTEYHAVAIQVGNRHGLTPEQSIAFFFRTTLGSFEP
jgi:hypothetical protein